MNRSAFESLDHLTTPHLADGCLRAGVPVRCGPAGLLPLSPGMRCAGRVRPVRHVGSIDVYFEALEHAVPGEVMVVDNGGRRDEACIGDIVALEVKAAGLAGMVIWGLHRDDGELRDIGYPVFSLGSLPTGPQRLHSRPADLFERAAVGPHGVTAGDVVVADSNGVLFLPADRLDAIAEAAIGYRATEARQIEAMRGGRSYRSQVRFADYLSRRQRDPGYDFRRHLREIAGAGEV
ncbi:MAG: RraA family protein [Thalassobaculum sp.]|uniref:RraA family protein n=1 Tax=Thalassobaculum sp. TaxID=2022740 RepID=UPI0032EBE1DA